MYEREEVLKYFKSERDFLNTTVKENIEKYRKGDDSQDIEHGDYQGGDHGADSGGDLSAQLGCQGDADDIEVTAEAALTDNTSAAVIFGSDQSHHHAQKKQPDDTKGAVDHRVPGDIRQIPDLIDIHKEQAGQADLKHQRVAVLQKMIIDDILLPQDIAREDQQHNGNHRIDCCHEDMEHSRSP